MIIQGVFDDAIASTRSKRAYADTSVRDAEWNTQEFVGNMSEWKDQGLLAFTVGLQGGSPHCYGNAGWLVSALDAESGALDLRWAAWLQLILAEVGSPLAPSSFSAAAADSSSSSSSSDVHPPRPLGNPPTQADRLGLAVIVHYCYSYQYQRM